MKHLLAVFGLGLALSLTTIALSTDGADAQTSTDVPSTTERGLPDVEGVWAQKLVTTGVNNAPIVGDVTSQTITFQKIDIDQSGKRLEFTEKACDVTIDSEQSAIRTIVPDKFVRALAPVERHAELRVRGDGVYFFAPKTIKTFGVRLEDKGGDLPDSPDDPRVFDQDKDGHPGMTVRVEGLLSGSLYLIQRSWDELWGKVLDSGQIAGRTTWHTDQTVLEKSGRIFGEVSAAKLHPNDKLSYFRMVKVADDTTCAEIAKRGDALFE